MQAVFDNFDLVLQAFALTLILVVISGICSMLLGSLLAVFRVGPIAVLRRATSVYLTLVRNTPLLVMFMFFQFAGPKIGIQFNWVDIQLGPLNMSSFFAAAVVSMTLYTSAFVCEALRSGVNAVPMGQAEAARAIGLPFGGVMREIVLPQALRAAVPPLASVQIAMVKNTSVAGLFGVAEALSQMRILTNNHADEKIGIFIAFALGYIIIVELLSFGASRLERRWRIA